MFWRARGLAMPVIHALGQWRIMMFFFDHPPPHFHVVTRDGSEALVRIADLVVTAGAVRPKVLAAALDWASDHRELLWAKWHQLHTE
jgi:hypothetical protein